MDLSKRPDASDIDSMQAHLFGIWQRTHTERWSMVDQYYNGTYAIWPEGSTRPNWLRSPKGRAIIDHAVDNLLAFEPTLKRYPVGQDEDDKIIADNVEKTMQSIMMRAALVENVLTWKQVGKNLLLYGYAVVHDAIDAKELRQSRDKPKKRKAETSHEFDRRMSVYEHRKKTMMPFRTRAPHPARVLMDPSSKEPRVAINQEMRRAQDLFELTDNRINKKTGKPKEGKFNVEIYEPGSDPFELVDTREWWSERWHGLVTNGSLLFVEENDWGFVPYSQAFAGFGQEPTDWKDLDPYWLAVGMLDPILPALKAINQALAGRHNSLMQATFPDKMTTMDASELMDQKARGDVYLEVDTKDAVWTEDIPNYTRWMFMAEEALESEIEFSTFASNIAGIRQPGTITVGQEAIQVQAAQKKFIAPLKQLEGMASNSASHILQLIDVLDLHLEIEGRDIQPSDLDKDYSIRAKFETLDPVFQLQLRELGLAEHAQGLLSDESYWEDYAKRQDGTVERVRLLKMTIRKLPAVQQKMALAAAREMGIDDLLEEEMVEDEGGGGSGGTGGSGPQLVGPDGNPIASSMGKSSPQQAVNQIRGSRNQLRQPLTGRVTKRRARNV